MPFAQINYQDKQGINGKYTIAEIGCFITSFCNLLERFGRAIDPPTLNRIFVDRGIYIDIDDGVRDDVGWGTISALDGHVVVTGTGNGRPPSSDAIVKFIYTSPHTGKPVTHFCLVIDHNAGTIIDSWDGKVKSWNVYGGPVAYATYANTQPQPIAPAPAPAPAGKKLFLPSAAGTWRVYNLGGPYSVGHEVGKLAPGSFPPGLTYDVLGNIAPSIVKIHTETFGDVAIYVGGDTIAQYVDSAPAPAPTPPPPPAPVPSTNTVYTKLANPLDLIVNKNTGWWKLDFKDDAHVEAAAPLTQGTPFRAFGKAQRIDGDRPAYFMTEEDFGNADQSGIPNNNNGVNTVDLSPVPPPPAPEPPKPAETPAAAPKSDSEAVSVPVKVNTWKETFKEAFGTYRATSDVTVKDLEGKLPDQHLGHDQRVTVAGTFTKDGTEYYLTVKSHNYQHFYGIPKNVLVHTTTADRVVNDIKKPLSAIAHQAIDDIDQIAADLNKDPEFQKFKHTLTPRGKAVASIAEAEDKVAGVFKKVNIFKKKYK